jgi:predicted nucleotide-binding protein
MPYYDVKITVQGESRIEGKNSISENVLETQFLAPYRAGLPITINGRTIQPSQLTRIQVLEILAGRPPDDVTDQFITGPPGTEVPSTLSSGSINPAGSTALVGPGDKRSVFIVSGRDNEATAGIVHILRAMNLRIVEWEHAVLRTGVPNPYTGDVVSTGLRMADAAIIIITPDDVVKLRTDLLYEDDREVERTIHGQARPNVIYEAGYADALGLNRTLIIEVGQSKPFSDISGRNTLRYDGSPAKRNALAQRLRLAGLEPDTGGDDWLTLGDVTRAITKAAAALEAERHGA